MPSYSETRIGNMYCKFSVAVGRGKDLPTDWYNVVCFGKTAEIAAENVRKGVLVEVYGRMQSNKHEDKTFWDLIAQRVYTFSPKERVQQVEGSEVTFNNDEIPF